MAKALLSLTLFFIVSFILIKAIPSSSRPLTTTPSTQFIRSSCTGTAYPSLCFSSLSTYANKIQTSKRLLANTALSVALTTTQSTSSTMGLLLKSKPSSRRDLAALRDCVEVTRDAVEMLGKSMEEMGRVVGSSGPDFRFRMSNVQTWVSAALTDQDTCVEGFSDEASKNGGGFAGDVSGEIVKVSQLTSNALGLVNSFAGRMMP
ncbi:21 kDa protein-like protein [Drosera capensis]